MKKLRLAIVLIMVALLFILVAFNGSFDTITAEDLETDNITLEVMSDVKEYVMSTGLPSIRLQQQWGLLSDNETGYNWDCDDYAKALAEQARIDGVDIGLALTFKERYNGEIKVHMTNFAIIKNRIVEVSAQTGSIKEYWFGHRVKVD